MSVRAGRAAWNRRRSTSDSVPVGSLPGWSFLMSEDFTRNAPLGSFVSTYGGSWAGYDGGTDTSRNLGRPTATQGHYDSAKTCSVHDSMLDIRVYTDSGGVPRVAAPIPTLPTADNWSQLYGRYAVRFKSEVVPGFKVACLLWPAEPNGWSSGEVDFPEAGLGDTIGGFSHEVDGDPSNNALAINTGVAMTGWHTTVIEWTPGQVRFLLDGVQVGLLVDGPNGAVRVPHVKMFWVLQTETQLSSTPPPASSQGHVFIDWVAAWAYAP